MYSVERLNRSPTNQECSSDSRPIRNVSGGEPKLAVPADPDVTNMSHCDASHCHLNYSPLLTRTETVVTVFTHRASLEAVAYFLICCEKQLRFRYLEQTWSQTCVKQCSKHRLRPTCVLMIIINS